MSLSQRLTECISACFSAAWVESYEDEDALREIAQMCREQGWRLASWDVEEGLQIPGQTNGQAADAGGNDPLAAIRAINALASPDNSAILVLTNFHRYSGSPEIVQALARQIALGKTKRTFLIVLSPVVQIPVELVRPKPTAYGRATLTGSAVPASLSRPSAGVAYRDGCELVIDRQVGL